MYFWWSLCPLYLHACQVRVAVGDSGLCCCTRVTYFKNKLTPLLVDSARALWASFCFRVVFPFLTPLISWSVCGMSPAFGEGDFNATFSLATFGYHSRSEKRQIVLWRQVCLYCTDLLILCLVSAVFFKLGFYDVLCKRITCCPSGNLRASFVVVDSWSEEGMHASVV